MIDVSAFIETLGGKPVAVFGLGVSGQATVKALEAAGATVLAADDKTPDVTLDEAALSTCACLILSPGVPLYYPAPHDVVRAARGAGIDIFCDVEVFGRSNSGHKVIGITGTNGKSTTAALMHHVLNECGLPTELGGNIGKAALDMEALPEGGVYVLELSSYQLDLCPSFSPDISILLNVTPDHIERHGSIENYASAKAHIFEGQGDAIIAVDDSFTKRIADDVEQKGMRDVHRISSKNTLLETPALKGDHNRQNMAAVMKAASLLGLDEAAVKSAIESFPGLAHRQFPVRILGGVTYINDSKATNAEAASKALASFDDIYWILGGQAKEGGLNGLEVYTDKICHAFLIGEAADIFADWLSKNGVEFTQCGTLDIAVQKAHETSRAHDGGTVLLSPACASWDQFSSFADRGDQFTNLVNALPET